MRSLALIVLSVLALSLTLTLPRPPAAAAADGPELLPNASLESEDTSADEPVDWTGSYWRGDGATWSPSFTYVKDDGHTGAHSVKVQVSGYSSPGDAKWMVDPWPDRGVPVTAGKYYVFSDWYKSNVSTAVSVWYASSDPLDEGHWANLFSGIPAAEDWTQYTTGFTMPAGAERAYFVHFVAGNGFLQTDDYSMRETDAPAGFSHPLISLTFDNGSRGIMQRAIPELTERGFVSTQYIPTQEVRQGVEWMMTPANIQGLAATGHEIGSHSETHPFLTQVSAQQLASELSMPKSLLEGYLGSQGSVPGFAYPYGDYDATVIEALKAAGYRSGRSVEPGYNTALNLERYDIRVQNVTISTTVEEFKTWVDYAKANNYWLVLVYHEVLPDDPTIPQCTEENVEVCVDPYDTRLATFEGMLDYIGQTGLSANVVTVRQALWDVANEHPTGSVTISPATPATNEVLTAAPVFGDPDGDQLTYAYQWFRGTAAIVGATAKTLDLAVAGHGDRGDEIRVQVTARDGHGNTNTAEAAVTVRNTAPTAGAVTLSPISPTAATPLAARPSRFADVDRDALSYRYRWLRNGVPIAGRTAATLPAGAGAAGDRIAVEVQAADGHGGTSAVATAAVTLRSPSASAPDTVGPVITIKSPSGHRYRRGRKLRISFLCSDPSGVAASKATLFRKGGSTRRVKPGARVRLARAGRYVLTITATDGLGNRTVKKVRFRVTAS